MIESTPFDVSYEVELAMRSLKTMIMPKAVIAIAGLVFLSTTCWASPWAEAGDNQLRSDIELLHAAGILDVITIHWPIPWQSILHELRNGNLAAQPSAIQAAARRLLVRAKAGTAPWVCNNCLYRRHQPIQCRVRLRWHGARRWPGAAFPERQHRDIFGQTFYRRIH